MITRRRRISAFDSSTPELTRKVVIAGARLPELLGRHRTPASGSALSREIDQVLDQRCDVVVPDPVISEPALRPHRQHACIDQLLQMRAGALRRNAGDRGKLARGECLAVSQRTDHRLAHRIAQRLGDPPKIRSVRIGMVSPLSSSMAHRKTLYAFAHANGNSFQIFLETSRARLPIKSAAVDDMQGNNHDSERQRRGTHLPALDEALGNKDLEGALALYAPDATIESPLVQHLMLTGTASSRAEALREFITRVFRTNPPQRRRFKQGFFSDGRILTWEYPRQALMATRWISSR